MKKYRLTKTIFHEFFRPTDSGVILHETSEKNVYEYISQYGNSKTPDSKIEIAPDIFSEYTELIDENKSIFEKLGITEGPWEEQGNDVIGGPGYDIICDWVSSTPNEKLICAAPEMLEALIDDIVKAEINWVDNNDFSFSPDEESILKECHRLNEDKINIIKKATGKSWEEIKELF